MTTVRLSPNRSGRRNSQRWTVGLSLLLHALALLALLTLARRPEDESAGAPSYELMFEPATPTAPATGGGTAPAAPKPDAEPKPEVQAAPPPPPAPLPVPDALPGPATPPATAPPVPDSPIMPQQPAPADAPPDSAPAAPTAPASTPVTPAPPAPSPPSQAEVRLDTPPDLPPPRPMVPDLVMPPPPPLPAPRPLARAAPRPPPPPTTGTFANPMDLNFGPSTARGPAARVIGPRGSVASRSLDLSPGAPKAGPNRTDAFFDIRAANLGADWEQSLKSYWLRHRFYPRQAAENNEDGTVDLELTVDGSGKVQSAVVKSRSGSAWLDMAAVSTWRSAQLAPLPPELAPRYTFSITINYILIR